jgi:NAD(P)H-hydrate epimerase
VEHGTRLTFAVTTAAEAAARDRDAITSGIPSIDLMHRAGAVTARVIRREYADRLADGVVCFAGPGNNGGDAWIVAAELVRAGVRVSVIASGAPRTPDARRAAAEAAPLVTTDGPTGREQVVVDGLLGTGHRGSLREEIARGCAQLQAARHRGACVVALDLPSGLDATTGEMAHGTVAAHCTVTFGTIKRGLLLQRATVGRLVVADIGLGVHGQLHGRDGAWRYSSPASLSALLPPISWNAHKGTRGRVAFVGGQVGMAGATAWAARGALHSGAGLVRVAVEPPSLAPLQTLVPQATAVGWEAFRTGVVPDDGGDALIPEHFDAVAIGPGLGRTDYVLALLEQVVWNYAQTPLLLDADALTLVAHAARAQGIDARELLASWAENRPALVCTPHPGEFQRLLGAPLPAAWEARAELVRTFARDAGITLLLKGTPTLVASPRDVTLDVVPHGTPLLATGGSGDLLTGIIATLLAQGMAGPESAVMGATVHGLAAEAATARLRGVRGGTLETVLDAMPEAWRTIEGPSDLPPDVLAVFAR